GRQATVAQLARAQARRGFDLAVGPLLRGRLLLEDEQQQVVLLTMHHIISDAWSVGLMIGEVSHLYERQAAGAASGLEELAVQYADYAVWQRQWLRGAALAEQLGYWREQLGGVSGSAGLPTDRRRGGVASERGASVEMRYGKELKEGLQEV